MTYQWINPPRKITKDEFWTIQDFYSVDIEPDQVPDNDAFRYTDSEDNFYCDDPDDGDGYADCIGGYYFIAEDEERLREGRAADACVQVKGATYFILGQHAENSPHSNLGNVASRGELYIISLQDYKAIDHGSTFSTYMLDELKTDLSNDDPYLRCVENEIGEPVSIKSEDA